MSRTTLPPVASTPPDRPSAGTGRGNRAAAGAGDAFQALVTTALAAQAGGGTARKVADEPRPPEDEAPADGSSGDEAAESAVPVLAYADRGPLAGTSRSAAETAQAGKVQAGEAQAGEVQAGEVQAGKVQAGKVQAGKVQAGEAQAGKVQAGEVQADPAANGEADAASGEPGATPGGLPAGAASGTASGSADPAADGAPTPPTPATATGDAGDAGDATAGSPLAVAAQDGGKAGTGAQDKNQDGATPQQQAPAAPTAPSAAGPSTAATAPTQGAAPATSAGAPPPGVPTASVPDQVFGEVVRLVGQGGSATTQRLTLQLSPEALGDVRVTLRVRDGALQVSLAAGAEAQRALVEGAPALRRILESLGTPDAKVVIRDLAGQTPQTTPSTATTGQAPHQGDDLSGRGEERGQDHHAGTRGGTTARDGNRDGDPHHGVPRPHETVTEARQGLDVTV